MWSIGIYKGESPFQLAPHPDAMNPVLHPTDIDDLNGVSIADPFMLRSEGIWHMFFEVLDGDNGKGCIGLATSPNAITWSYDQIVLTEKFHLSYPYVFANGSDYYMIPETVEGGGICLYKATNFPHAWTFQQKLIEGVWADPSIFEYERQWWMFACGAPKESSSLHLFYAEDLLGPWIEHPASPLISCNHRIARPAGRVTVYDDQIVRFCQDCEPRYGTRVRAFVVDTLTTTDYAEREHPLSPILVPQGIEWNSERMHHVDPHLEWPGEWIACVDGCT